MNTSSEKREAHGRPNAARAAEGSRPGRFRIAILAVRRTLQGAQTKAFLGSSTETQ